MCSAMRNQTRMPIGAADLAANRAADRPRRTRPRARSCPGRRGATSRTTGSPSDRSTSFASSHGSCDRQHEDERDHGERESDSASVSILATSTRSRTGVTRNVCVIVPWRNSSVNATDPRMSTNHGRIDAAATDVPDRQLVEAAGVRSRSPGHAEHDEPDHEDEEDPGTRVVRAFRNSAATSRLIRAPLPRCRSARGRPPRARLLGAQLVEHDAVGGCDLADPLGRARPRSSALGRRGGLEPGRREQLAQASVSGERTRVARSGPRGQLGDRRLRDEPALARITHVVGRLRRARRGRGSTRASSGRRPRVRAGTSRSQRIPSGSRPLAGSSRTRTCGSPSSAVARQSRCRMPSEYEPARGASPRPSGRRAPAPRRRGSAGCPPPWPRPVGGSARCGRDGSWSSRAPRRPGAAGRRAHGSPALDRRGARRGRRRGRAARAASSSSRRRSARRTR